MSVIPRTAEKVYRRRVDADEEVLYVKPKRGNNYVRIHRHTGSGKLYNSYNDVIPADRFNKSIKKGTRAVSETDWEKIKKQARR